MSWFSLVIGQNTCRQLATSSENLVASAQFLVALATSESQFRTLQRQKSKLFGVAFSFNLPIFFSLLLAVGYFRSHRNSRLLIVTG